MSAIPVMVVWVKAPHFCCGLAVDRDTGKVCEAAPIVRWAMGKAWGYVAAYFARKGYEYTTWIDGHHPSQSRIESAMASLAPKQQEEDGRHGPDGGDDHDRVLFGQAPALPDRERHDVPAADRGE